MSFLFQAPHILFLVNLHIVSRTQEFPFRSMNNSQTKSKETIYVPTHWFWPMFQSHWIACRYEKVLCYFICLYIRLDCSLHWSPSSPLTPTTPGFAIPPSVLSCHQWNVVGLRTRFLEITGPYPFTPTQVAIITACWDMTMTWKALECLYYTLLNILAFLPLSSNTWLTI